MYIFCYHLNGWDAAACFKWPHQFHIQAITFCSWTLNCPDLCVRSIVYEKGIEKWKFIKKSKQIKLCCYFLLKMISFILPSVHLAVPQCGFPNGTNCNTSNIRCTVGVCEAEAQPANQCNHFSLTHSMSKTNNSDMMWKCKNYTLLCFIFHSLALSLSHSRHKERGIFY